MASIIGVETLQHTNGTTAATISSGGSISPKIVSFQVRALNTSQAYTTGSTDVVQYNNVDLDTESGWDATNHRYVASVAGWYMFSSSVRIAHSGSSSYANVSIARNTAVQGGTHQLRSQLNFSSAIITNVMLNCDGMIHLDANDYANVLFGSGANATLNEATNIIGHFSGVLVKAD